jgi:hypothetical protein
MTGGAERENPQPKPAGVNSEAPRARIADIIRTSGKMGADTPGVSNDQLSAIASAIGTGASAGTVLASEAITDELAKRFPKLAPTATVERDFDAAYEQAGRALILALQACSMNVSAAFDTGSGAMLEVKKPMSLTAPPYSITIAITDRGASTHFSAQAQHTGMDWGQNAKLLGGLFDKTDDYLKLFKS